jgi:hypothetical protein
MTVRPVAAARQLAFIASSACSSIRSRSFSVGWLVPHHRVCVVDPPAPQLISECRGSHSIVSAGNGPVAPLKLKSPVMCHFSQMARARS